MGAHRGAFALLEISRYIYFNVNRKKNCLQSRVKLQRAHHALPANGGPFRLCPSMYNFLQAPWCQYISECAFFGDTNCFIIYYHFRMFKKKIELTTKHWKFFKACTCFKNVLFLMMSKLEGGGSCSN